MERLLSEADDGFERRYALKVRGMDVDRLAETVAKLLGLPAEGSSVKAGTASSQPRAVRCAAGRCSA